MLHSFSGMLSVTESMTAVLADSNILNQSPRCPLLSKRKEQAAYEALMKGSVSRRRLLKEAEYDVKPKEKDQQKHRHHHHYHHHDSREGRHRPKRRCVDEEDRYDRRSRRPMSGSKRSAKQGLGPDQILEGAVLADQSTISSSKKSLPRVRLAVGKPHSVFSIKLLVL